MRVTVPGVMPEFQPDLAVLQSIPGTDMADLTASGSQSVGISGCNMKMSEGANQQLCRSTARNERWHGLGVGGISRFQLGRQALDA